MFGSAFSNVIPNYDSESYYDSKLNYFTDVMTLDCLMRYTVSGKSEELFKKLAESFFAAENISSIHILCAAIILYKKRKFKMLDIFIDAMKNYDGMSENYHYSRSMNLVNLKKYLTMINKFVMGVGEYEETGGMYYFMTSPCYFAMITNNTEEFKKYILSDEFERNKIMYFCSAAAFRNTEILRLMFDSGIEFPMDTDLIADLYLDKGTAEYLTLNFSKYIFPDKQEISDVSDIKMPAFFIQQMIPPEKMAEFAWIIFKKEGAERLCEIFRDMPKISCVEEYSLAHIHNLEVHGVPMKEILADTVECIVQGGEYFFERGFKPPEIVSETGIKFLLDFTYVSRPCLYHRKIEKIMKLLKNAETRFRLDTLSYPVKEMLDRNHEALTELLISKKIINRTNVYEVIDHLAEKKLYTALNVVNHSEIPDIDIEEM